MSCIRWQVCCTTGPNAHEASYIFLTDEFSAGDDAQNRARLVFEHIASAPSTTWSGSRSHGDEKGRSSAAYYDISDNHSSSSSNDWAIPFHFGCAEEDGPSLDETHAFGPEILREIEKASLRDEVALDSMD